MLKLSLADFTLEHFMQHYWQQKPVVIRQGFKGFQDLISPEELAGLACEEAVDSRLVYKKRGKWQAESGPFESYDHLGKKGWSLIVQAVNHWSPAVAELVKPFAFIPKWRLDDVMISYSRPDGGVGPHIDLYDVFICQGSGRRQWRVGDTGPHRQFAAHAALLHVDPFEAIIDVELLPGDILYIPPGFPHDGVSLEPSMSFSVGFRGKSACDMLSGLADYVIDKDLGSTLLSDPGRPVHTHQGHINASDFARIKAQLQSILDDETLVADFAGSFLSRTKCQLDLQALDEPLNADDVLAALEQQPLVRTGGLRCFYLDTTVAGGVCYVDGERHAFGAKAQAAVKALCDHDTITHTQLRAAVRLPVFVAALVQWVNAGYWYFED
ncbi:JmjC domain-containing protein [Candidatus Aalborgicola defluviihabitans]|uniref:JmjC domain-containing protein n=1 Tax=Candidatus Aalborgicola defluviihabitans TaxID=3386187 RepID=UPI001DB4CFA6|nr:cupin domain-containing protein [Burkholderiales bacterium]MBK6570731.1 cupin domain-containing protein [Burkholderiales bacterium]MBK7279724.1 cupin domain-containing protein [Burkholderiales bacterium]MBK7312588.1 cupin domain-containing protein [Burkholderiales bacterium]MBL0243398.1 cupin domain-containing protein [Rhodoferax sp.]